MAPRLDDRLLADPGRPGTIAWPGYDRSRVRAGIAHIGVGNFHRAHQAVAVDRCLHDDGQHDWGICGIGLGAGAASRARARALREQDGLYGLTEYADDGTPSVRVIGSLLEYLVAPDDPEAVLARLASPAIRIVSLTITEGGYNLDAATHAFRADTEAVRHDLAHRGAPTTAFGFIVEALRRRRADGVPPFTVMSCDNQRENGAVARAAVLGFARAADPRLADWIEASVACPNSMVDRIVPTVGAADVETIRARTGLDDRAPVVAERFSQWVLQDRFPQGRPAWERHGVEMEDDVAPFEAMKGRLLNASHMMLCFPGLLLGYRRADEAMGDGRLARLCDTFMRQDVLPIIEGPTGVDLDRYRASVLLRFGNPAIGDQLIRIASDGASKVPTFLARTLADAIARDRPLERLAFVVACFGRYFGGLDERGAPFEPIEPHLPADELGRLAGSPPEAILTASPLRALGLDRSARFVSAFRAAAASWPLRVPD